MAPGGLRTRAICRSLRPPKVSSQAFSGLDKHPLIVALPSSPAALPAKSAMRIAVNGVDPARDRTSWGTAGVPEGVLLASNGISRDLTPSGLKTPAAPGLKGRGSDEICQDLTDRR